MKTIHRFIHRLFATSLENKLQGRFERVNEKPILGYIKGYEQPSLKTKMESWRVS